MRPWATAFFTALITIVSATGCASDDSDAAGPVAETVVLYSPFASELKPLYRAFEEAHPGIRVEGVRMGTNDVVSRLRYEASSGQHTASVVLTSTVSPAWTEAELFTPYMPASAAQLPPEARGPHDLWFTPYNSAHGIMYNTDEVAEDELPRSWDDVVDPRWTGKISLTYPSSPNLSAVAMVPLLNNDLIDEKWMSELAALEPKYFTQTPQVTQSLTTGETVLAISSYAYTQVARELGAPVDFIPELAVMSPTAAALVAGGPNQAASKSFLDFTLTPEGQEALRDSGLYPAMPGSSLPEGFTRDMPQYLPPVNTEDSVKILNKVTGLWKQLVA